MFRRGVLCCRADRGCFGRHRGAPFYFACTSVGPYEMIDVFRFCFCATLFCGTCSRMARFFCAKLMLILMVFLLLFFFKLLFLLLFVCANETEKQIGRCLCNIVLGFGVKLLCVEPFGEIPELVERGAKFVEIDEVRGGCGDALCAGNPPTHPRLPATWFLFCVFRRRAERPADVVADIPYVFLAAVRCKLTHNWRGILLLYLGNPPLAACGQPWLNLTMISSR